VGRAVVLARLRDSKKKKVKIAMQQQQLGKTAMTGAVKKNKQKCSQSTGSNRFNKNSKRQLQ